MLSLLSLHESVLVPILTEWIFEVDLCCLDSAVCNKVLRSYLIALLKNCFIINTNFNLDDNKARDEWILNRSLKLKVLRLESQMNLPPVVSNHLLHVTVSDSDRLDLLLLPTIQSIGSLEVVLELRKPLPEALSVLGHLVTHCRFMGVGNSSRYAELPSICPKIRKVTCGRNSKSEILPLIEACELDIIERCGLQCLMKRRSFVPSFYCNLARVSGINEASICLAEGKSYRVTSIENDSLSPEDVELLTPFLSTLEGIHISQMITAQLAAARCKNLTELKVNSVHLFHDETLAIIKNCCQLRWLVMGNSTDVVTDGDALISAASLHCPQLKNCNLRQFSVGLEAATRLLRGTELTMFICSPGLDLHCLSSYAVNLTSLIVRFNDGLVTMAKEGRLCNRLYVAGAFSADMIATASVQNCCSLTEINLTGAVYLDCSLLDLIVSSCPMLHSVSLTGDKSTDCSFLSSLIVCSGLTELSLRALYTEDESVYLNVLRNKVHLKALYLNDCSGYGAVLLSLIASTCVNLLELHIVENKDITSSDVIEVLQGCRRLESIALLMCPLVTTDILSHIVSPPMRKLSLRGCSITGEDLKQFDKVQTLSVRLS